MRKVFVATPCYSGKLAREHTSFVAQMSIEAHSMGLSMDYCVRTTDSILTRARNCLVAKFMETDATDFLFVDSDVWASPGTFTQIMKHDEDIIGGCYPHRGDDHDGFVFRPLEDKLM